MNWGTRLVCALIVATALRVITVLFVPAVQDAAFARFHLKSSSFLLWAVQAPVPAMYNFRNTWQLESLDWDHPPMSPSIGGTVNHFPARILTFGDMRRTMAEERARTRVRLESTYLGRSFVSVWRLEDVQGGTIVVLDEAGR